MTPRADEYWRIYQTFDCPFCGAKRGSPCTTKSGTKATVWHQDRTRSAGRCPVCGDVLPRDTLAGDLCARCALVRSLEIERATIYRPLG